MKLKNTRALYDEENLKLVPFVTLANKLFKVWLGDRIGKGCWA